MKLQLYTRASGAWTTIKTYNHDDHNAVRDEALELAREKSVGIGGLRIMIGNKTLTHWNAMQGWVDHYPNPQKKPISNPPHASQSKHPEYSKPENRTSKERRRCLSCENLFWSQGAHNRLCTDCRRDTDSVPLYTAHFPARI